MSIWSKDKITDVWEGQQATERTPVPPRLDISGSAWGYVTFDIGMPIGRTKQERPTYRAVQLHVKAETILALADAIRCCPRHINADPATGRTGAEYPPKWIGHALWHLQNPDRVRPCLEHGREILDTTEAGLELPPHEEDDDDGSGR